MKRIRRFDSILQFLGRNRSLITCVFACLFAISLFPARTFASASITVSSLSLASDGRTLTGTLAGGSGSGYNPSSSISGFTVHGPNSNLYPVISSTISGTTVTLVIPIISSGATLTVDLSSSSNLTDSGSNTAQGQTGLAVTNNSSKTATAFAFNNASLVIGGIFSDNTVAGRSNRSFSNATVVFDFIGTGINAVDYLQGGTYKVSIDGAAFSTINEANSTAYGVTELASGLSDANHTIAIFLNGRNSDKLAGLQVVGASPSISAPTGYAQPIDNRDASIPSYIRYDGALINGTTGGVPTKDQEAGAGGDVTLVTDAPKIQLYGYGQGQNIRLYVDGAISSIATIPNAAFGFYFPFTGLDTSTKHTYRLFAVGQQYFQSVTPVGGTGLSTTTVLPTRRLAVFHGDSITVAYGTAGDLSLSWNGVACATADSACMVMGASGSTMTASGVSFAGSVTGRTYLTTPGAIFILHGTNDMTSAASSTNPNSTEISAFKSAYTSTINTYRTAYPNAIIYAAGIFKRGDTYDSNGSRATWNAAIQSVVTAAADSKTLYVNTDNWYNGSSGTHPDSSSSQTQIAPRLTPFISSAPYSVSSPSSGISGQASTNFTVSLNNSAKFDGFSGITLADGSNGGTFTPSVGSPGSNSVTVTPTNGSSSFTFTYTPASAGSKTLTYTNGQGWIDPGTASYTSVSPDNTPPTVSLTTPTTGSTVSGSSVSLAANASDDTAVSGVQFKLDTNTSIGAEDTSNPYGVTWDSTGVADGSHTIVAVARDAAGNKATSTAISVTVDNTAPIISSIATSTTSSSATITWTTNETADTQVNYGATSSYTASTTLNPTPSTSHSVTISGLSANTAYHLRGRSTDGFGHLSVSGDNVVTTAVAIIPVQPIPVSSGGGGQQLTQSQLEQLYPALSTLPQPVCSSGFAFNTSTGKPCATSVVGTTIPPAISLIASTFTHDLELGMSNAEVQTLQKYLNKHGFIIAGKGGGSPGNETTYFGNATRAALMKYQIVNNIKPAKGYFGRVTRAAVLRIAEN